MNSTSSAGALTVDQAAQLQRPCPACGNLSRDRCRRVYTIPEGEVLRCRDCHVTFINRAIDDNVGIELAQDLEVDPLLLHKAISDFRELKSYLQESGITEFRNFCLLDVGCRLGTYLALPLQEGWKVRGLEISPEAAAYAREKNGFAVITGSIENPAGLEPGSMDVITMYGVIEHLSDPPRGLRECARVLRPGGFLVLQTPTEDGLARRMGRFLFWMSGGHAQFLASEFYQMGGGHNVCFNRRSITCVLERCGFRVSRIHGSTYGLRTLFKRFEDFSLFRRVLMCLGTSVVFSLGRILGASNHMTVYARRT